VRYAKAIVAVLTAGLLAAQTAIHMSDSAHGWVTVILASLGAFGVYQVPNSPAPVEPPPRAPLVAGALPFYTDPPAPPTIAPPVPGRYPASPPLPKE
jgi:hypothetical protein